MSEPFVAGVGAVLSADIAVPQLGRELRFYSRILSTGAEPFWREDLMNNRGYPIIGMGERTEDYADLPLQWMPHIQVADVDASVEQALELGAKILMDSRAEDGTSLWAVVLDPHGAAFGLVPVTPPEILPRTAPGENPDHVGRILWLDITVPDAPATRDFYQRVVGGSVQEVELKDGEERYADYNMLDEGGRPAAGVCHARGSNASLPPVWMLYLPVGDLAESLRRVEAEGGKVIRSVKGEGGQYVYAAVQDPIGVNFSLVSI